MHLIGRRNFLAGMGIGAGAPPLLGAIFNRILPEALGAEDPGRKRLLLFTHGGGLIEEDYTCSGGETNFTLTPALAPLEPFKKDLLVLSKFYVPFDARLHGNQFAVLSMTASPDQDYDNHSGRPPGGISFDRFMGSQIGKDDAFTSIASGIPEGLSADGLRREFPAIGDPARAYSSFFGGALGDVHSTLAQDHSILDALHGDIMRMSARLGGPERAKLEQYTESLRGIERQVTKRAQALAACQTLKAPKADPMGLLTPEDVDAHIDIQVAAHLCGLTRVSHMTINASSSPHDPYYWLGDTKGYHDCHAEHLNDRPMVIKIANWVQSRVALMASKLAAVKEGNGTMLDNSVIMFINIVGGKHHGGYDTYSMITIGKGGGMLRTGRYLTYPVKQHSMADPFVAYASALGVPIKTFGDPKYCTGPLPGLI